MPPGPAPKSERKPAGSASHPSGTEPAAPGAAEPDRAAASGTPAYLRPPQLASAARCDPGQPLDADLRGELAPAFGDLSDVRVHTGAAAAQASRAVDAPAFTVGRDLFFDTGVYRPQSAAGRRVIAHEAAHAVQQRHVDADHFADPAPPDAQAEKDAHTAATLGVRPQLQATAAQVMAHPKTADEIFKAYEAEGRWYERDEKGLGKRLFELASESPDNYPVVGQVLDKLLRGARVGVAQGFIEAAGPAALDEFARTERGRVLVNYLRDSFLRPGLFIREEVALKISVDDVLGRAEGRNRAEAALDAAFERSRSEPLLDVEPAADRKAVDERLRLVRQMLLQIQLLHPDDVDIASAVAGLQSDLDLRFGGLLFSFFEHDGKQATVTQIIVERAYRSLMQFDLDLPNLTDPTGRDPSQIHRLALAGRVRGDWIKALKNAASPEGPALLAAAEAESAALPGALYDLYLGTVAAHRQYFTDMPDGSDDMVAWAEWVRERRQALDAEIETLDAAVLAGAADVDERIAKAAREAELLVLSVEGIQLWEQGVRAHETLYVEIHPLLNVVPHVPLSYRDARRIRARCQQMKTAALADDLKTLKELAAWNRSDPAIQNYLRAIPLFIFGAKAAPGMAANLLLSYAILRLSLMASTAAGGLVRAAAGGSLRAIAAQVGLEALTFTGVSRTLQAAVGSPSKTPFWLDLVLNAGLFGVLRVTSPAIHNMFASRGMDFAAWAVPHASTLATLQAFGVLHFRLEQGHWPSAEEFRGMAAEGLVLYAALARTARAPALRAPTSRLAILETLHSKFGDRLGAFENARTLLARRIADEVRAGRANDPAAQKELEAKSATLNEDLKRLVDDIAKDPQIGIGRLRRALADPALPAAEISSELLTRSLDLPPETKVARAGGESQFTFESGTSEVLIEALEANGVVRHQRDASGRNMVTAELPDQAPMFFLERAPAAAFAPGTAPRKAGEITRFLESSGLTASEIIGYGGANASRLGSRTAGRVARLAEHFTASDLKALGDFLWRYDIVIDNATVDVLIDRVSAGGMADAVASLEGAARQIEQTGTRFEMAESLGITVRGPPRRSSSSADPFPRFDPAWRTAEKQLGPALENKFGPGWQPSKRVAAPGAAQGETLGSTVPEYFNPDLTPPVAVEGKRLDLAELGIGPAGETIATPSEGSNKALARARRQLAGRRWAMKRGTEQYLVFNVTGQATDVVAVGRRLRALIGERFIKYDRVFVQNGTELTEIE
jgi:hypothetical protein